jgi:hypothetical protein
LQYGLVLQGALQCRMQYIAINTVKEHQLLPLRCDFHCSSAEVFCNKIESDPKDFSSFRSFNLEISLESFPALVPFVCYGTMYCSTSFAAGFAGGSQGVYNAYIVR